MFSDAAESALVLPATWIAVARISVTDLTPSVSRARSAICGLNGV
jgi:hypothetical protein